MSEELLFVMKGRIMYSTLNIGGIEISISGEMIVLKDYAVNDFFVNTSKLSKPDIQITIKRVDIENEFSDLQYLGTCRNTKYPAGNLWNTNRYAVEEQDRKIAVIEYSESRTIKVFLNPDEAMVWNGSNLFGMLSMEMAFLHFGMMMLHSSFIWKDGHAILFSGVSGAGKSTQAEIWEKNAGYEVINGDRSLVGMRNNVWTANGVPLAGSSGIYKNKTGILDAIVLLEKSENLKIRKLAPMEAFAKLLPQLTVHDWDSGFIEEISKILQNMVENVPVFVLQCYITPQTIPLVLGAIEREQLVNE